MPSILNEALEWLDRAEQAREVAGQLTDPHAIGSPEPPLQVRSYLTRRSNGGCHHAGSDRYWHDRSRAGRVSARVIVTHLCNAGFVE